MTGALRLPRSLSALIASALLVGVCSMPLTAEAQESGASASDGDRAFARELAQQAFRALDAGDNATALQRFDQAIALYDVPTLRVGRAGLHEREARLIAAAEDYRAAARYAAQPGEPVSFAQAREKAQLVLPELERRIPRLVVRVDAEPSAVLLVDGREIPPAVWGLPQPVDPGSHRVELRVQDARQSQIAHCKEATTAELTFHAPAGPVAAEVVAPTAPAAAAGPSAAPPAGGSPPVDSSGATTSAKVPMVITSAVLVAATVVTGWVAAGAIDSYKKKRDANAEESVQEDFYDHARLWQWINTGTAVGALAASGYTAYLYLSPDGASGKPTALAGFVGHF